MGEGKIIKIYNKGVSEVITVIKKMDNENKELKAKLAALEKENEKLNKGLDKYEKQKKKNSTNSSKPPSSDGIGRRTKSLRKKSDKKPGGQEGHEGSTLKLSEKPDEVITLRVDKCTNCGIDLVFMKNEGYEIRQKIDILEAKLKTIEYRAEMKTCPKCGCKNKGKFPEGVDKTTQYGENVKSLSVYLSKYQMIPYGRLSEIFKDIFKLNISKGTLVNFNKKCYDNLEEIESNIKQALINSEVIHCDETGIKSKGKLNWTHVVSNKKLTHYSVHEKRGTKAIDDIGIIPFFKNTMVHDCFRSYNIYNDANHAICGAHILRELNGITDLEKQKWAQEFFDHLIHIKKAVDDAIENGNNHLAEQIQNELSFKYDEILEKGRKEDEEINGQRYNKRANAKKSKSLNLINRLVLYKDRMLAFMYDFIIPFTNNLAEQDLRMLKVSQKISGTYRGEHGAAWTMRINGYISTIRKNGYDLIQSLRSVFTSDRFDPTLPQS
ncbi:IS66 family transposase [Tepidibacter hydrothermalis]|uniref:IS66 family transposase n=1 Tax=Tepidibacter hydrothermalis TaxID=3036126 RepID=A0ABY8EJ13_9FIRM|nr:IS66 family transposase [Tepidibacter hydrothermalis]WFD10888.1 IS66 family transposase [Tepidibacter hydrothermalis]